MVWFDYKYLSLSEITKMMKHISEFWAIEIAILTIIVVLTFLLIVYLFPAVLYSYWYKIKQWEKNNKKLLLKKMKIQKDIWDEIENEIKTRDKEKAIAKDKKRNSI